MEYFSIVSTLVIPWRAGSGGAQPPICRTWTNVRGASSRIQDIFLRNKLIPCHVVHRRLPEQAPCCSQSLPIPNPKPLAKVLVLKVYCLGFRFRVQVERALCIYFLCLILVCLYFAIHFFCYLSLLPCLCYHFMFFLFFFRCFLPCFLPVSSFVSLFRVTLFIYQCISRFIFRYFFLSFSIYFLLSSVLSFLPCLFFIAVILCFCLSCRFAACLFSLYSLFFAYGCICSLNAFGLLCCNCCSFLMHVILCWTPLLRERSPGPVHGQSEAETTCLPFHYWNQPSESRIAGFGFEWMDLRRTFEAC